MKSRLFIIGASGHGTVVADVALKMNKWDNISFLDDDVNVESPTMGIEVKGSTSDVYKYYRESEAFVAIGNNTLRKQIQQNLEAAGVNVPILVHPNAVIGEAVELGPGTVVMAGAVINSCTKIGKGCIVNTGATIDHDNLIEEYVHVSPGVHLAGTVKVGQGTWLGIGSIVINNISITQETIIGAGAVVIRDITIPGTYVGVPARGV